MEGPRLEGLEKRELLSANPGYGLLETLDVSLASADSVRSASLLEDGRSYQLVAGGSGVIGKDRDGNNRGADAAWAQDWLKPEWTRSDFGVRYGTSGSPSTSFTGGYTSSHQYTADVTGRGSALSAKFIDNNYQRDNTGAISIGIWEQVLLDSIDVRSGENSAQSSRAHRTSALGETSPGPLYLGLPRTGGHEVSVVLDGSSNQSSFDQSMFKWMVEGGQVSGPSEGSGTSSSSLSLLEGASYTFTGWADWDGNGRLNGQEVSVGLAVHTVDLPRLEISEAAWSSNRIAVEVGGTQVLYAAAQEGGQYAVDLSADIADLPSEATRLLLWSASGTTDGFNAEQLRSTKQINLGATGVSASSFNEIFFGIDVDGDGQLTADEQHVAVRTRSFSVAHVEVDGNFVYYGGDTTVAVRDGIPIPPAEASRINVSAALREEGIPDGVLQNRFVFEIVDESVSRDQLIGGSLVPFSSQRPREITYIAGVERSSHIHPGLTRATFGVSVRGSNLPQVVLDSSGNEADVTARSVFTYFMVNGRRDDALVYVNSKYDLVPPDVFRRRFEYGGAGDGNGFRSAVPYVKIEIYDFAFDSENELASTIGHEYQHELNDDDRGTDNQERIAYEWEIDNAHITGLRDAELREVIQWWLHYTVGSPDPQ